MLTRAENEATINVVINERIFESNSSFIENAEMLVRTGTDAEISAIADAIRSDPSGFRGSFMHALFHQNTVDVTATLATVYSPDVHPGRSIHFRAQAMKTAYIHYVAADKSAYPELIDKNLEEDNELWTISNAEETLRARAKRFVAMTCAINDFKPRASLEFRTALSDIMLDDERTDHEEVINFLRAAKGECVTLPQLEFFITGGAQSISGGAL